MSPTIAVRSSTKKMSETLRIVHKLRYDEQTYLSIPSLAKPLEEYSVRLKAYLLGLSNNNLSYCLAGSVLHWWDAYPVPQTTSAPFNDTNTYGVAPGWGYAVVVESTIEDIPTGRILYGFLPLSSHTFDLKLQPSEIEETWIDVSLHRSKVLSMYQRYDVMPEGFDVDSSRAAWKAALIRCEAGMVLSKYVFPQDGKKPIHPFGPQISAWGVKEADLSGACVVAIASGTKTAKAFIWHLANTGRYKKPEFTLVEVTSGNGCKAYLKDIPFGHKIVAYGSASSPDVYPPHRKFILLNCGGRGNAFEDTYNAIRGAQPNSEVICIQIGSEPKVGTPESVQKHRQVLMRLQALQMNTTAIRDEAVAAFGEERYFTDLNGDFQALLDEQMASFDGRVLGLSMTINEGLQTERGIDGLWKRLVRGQIPADEAVAIRL